ncbi:hypothetical protein [Nocardia cyriacigeorgica]|uniref:hypothetical protein n=1 Tax=Nocardia cyriacigeorgica TaxID=135487 RepID=UPI0024576CCD|nr:hypothetical protein [Nocardia cyriacigeorgica]
MHDITAVERLDGVDVLRLPEGDGTARTPPPAPPDTPHTPPSFSPPGLHTFCPGPR